MSRTTPALSAVAAEQEAARLEAQSWKAVQDYNLYNPYRQDYLDKLRAEDPAAYARIKEQDAQQELLNTGLALTMEAAGAAREQQEQCSRKPTSWRASSAAFAKAKAALSRLSRDATDLERAGREFGKMSAAQVSAGAAGVATVARACPEAARTRDVIALAPPPGVQAAGPLVLGLHHDDAPGPQARRSPGARFEALAGHGLLAGPGPKCRPARHRRGRPGPAGGPRRRRPGSGRCDPQGPAKERQQAEKKMKESRWLGKGGAAANSGLVIY